MADEGDRGGTSKDLVVSGMTTGRLRAAPSLAAARPGEVLFINRRGQTLTRSQITRMWAASWAMVGASGILAGIVYAGLFSSPLAGVIAGAAVELLTLAKLRHWPALRTVAAQISASEWERAQAALLRLEQKRIPAGQREAVQVTLASLEAILGEPQRALDRLDRVRSSVSSWPARRARNLRWQAPSVRATALAALGRFEEAWRAYDEMVREAATVTGAPKRAPGDYLEMVLQGTQLRIAAEADRPDALPDDDTLHRWARAALGRSRFGEMLVALAWAFHRRGDDDMARHLLAEAPSRVPRWSLDRTAPRLHAWAIATAAKWEVSLEPAP